ncbi:MAG: hypothetical protein HUK11_08715 [Muribaculaceae bacterium]|nr:hypothetical protein [Muribaculaceae bacterium]
MNKIWLFVVCVCVSFILGYQYHKVEIYCMADEYNCLGETDIDSISDIIINKGINCYREYKISMFTQREYYAFEAFGMALFYLKESELDDSTKGH